MNAKSDPDALSRRSVALPTGTLDVTVTEGVDELEALLGFAARANAKRGFLFLSKVLGKHWPARPAAMRGLHEALAAQNAVEALWRDGRLERAQAQKLLNARELPEPGDRIPALLRGEIP